MKPIPFCRAHFFTPPKFFLDLSAHVWLGYEDRMKSAEMTFHEFEKFFDMHFFHYFCNFSSSIRARVLKILPDIHFEMGNTPIMSIWRLLVNELFTLVPHPLCIGFQSNSSLKQVFSRSVAQNSLKLFSQRLLYWFYLRTESKVWVRQV